MTSSTIRIRCAIRHVFSVEGSCVWRRRSRKNYLANWRGRGDIRVVPLVFCRRWPSVAGYGEETLLRGSLAAAKCRSRVNNPLRFGTGRNLWSHQRFDKRARKFIGGKERDGAENGGERPRARWWHFFVGQPWRRNWRCFELLDETRPRCFTIARDPERATGARSAVVNVRARGIFSNPAQPRNFRFWLKERQIEIATSNPKTMPKYSGIKS